MKKLMGAAFAAAIVSVSAVPSTASACDPNSPTCGHGNVVENVLDWTEDRVTLIHRAVEERLEAVALGPCPPACS